MSSSTLIHAAEDRPLLLRRRPDLEFSEARFQQERSWIVKDPVSLQYHRLKQPEMIVLQMLDGQVTLRDVLERVQSEYPTRIVRITDLLRLVSSLYRSGLVLSDAAGQGESVYQRALDLRRRQWLGRLTNILSIQLPGFDPGPLLNRLNRVMGWMFTPLGITLWFLLVAIAFGLVLGHWREFEQRLPGFYDFFSADRLWLLALVLSMTKILHELGHGIACRHFGGECHEIGIMFLVFTPAMYCDTSDSWRLPNKWHRIFIGAAGMYVELALASAACLIWWNTRPGWTHYVCLNVMFVSSVSSLLFNLNPLLRYDGYYMLADFLEVPNLAQKSQWALLNTARVAILGLPMVAREQLPQQNIFWFALYSVASFCYRWFILFLIIWFLTRFLEPYELQSIGIILAMIAMVGAIGVPFWRMIRYFLIPGVSSEVKWPRFVLACGVGCAILGGVAFIPLPRSLTVPVVIELDDMEAEHVYVSLEGSLSEIFVKPGDEVQAGTVLAELNNHDVVFRLAQLEGARIHQEGHLRSLRRRVLADPAALVDIPAAEAELSDLRKQLAESQREAERLQLVAHRDGIVFPPRDKSARPRDPEMGIADWYGSPFDPENRSVYLEAGTLFCSIANPKRFAARLLVQEDDIALIEPGQPTKLILDSYRIQPITSTIQAVSTRETTAPPPELTNDVGGPVAMKQGPNGAAQSMFVYYEAVALLKDPPLTLIPGFRGMARTTLRPCSLGSRFWKWIHDNIHFQ
jgi:putative peptide zinc metalloprotease protein